jgi:hypothetical protein
MHALLTTAARAASRPLPHRLVETCSHVRTLRALFSHEPLDASPPTPGGIERDPDGRGSAVASRCRVAPPSRSAHPRLSQRGRWAWSRASVWGPWRWRLTMQGSYVGSARHDVPQSRGYPGAGYAAQGAVRARDPRAASAAADLSIRDTVTRTPEGQAYHSTSVEVRYVRQHGGKKSA